MTFYFFRPFTNKYYKHKVRGTYVCKVCEEPIFDSATKFDSGSGWPSFYDVIDKESVVFKPDTSASKTNKSVLT
jgi:peptide-methionine (R)-S-oxide reductase